MTTFTVPKPFRCGLDGDGLPVYITRPDSLVTAAFDERDGRTTVTMTMSFDSREGRDAAMESGMEDGVAASYDRLAGILPQL